MQIFQNPTFVVNQEMKGDGRKQSPARKGTKGPDTGNMLYASDRARAKRKYGEESEDALFMSKLLDSKNIAEVEDLDQQAAATPEAGAGRAQGLRGHS